MDDRFSATALLELVHRFYPSGIASYEPGYDDTDEARRLTALRKGALEESDTWKSLLQRIEQEMTGCTTWELPYLLYDPCRCIRISLPHSPTGSSVDDSVVLLSSVLAPVHTLYASHQTYKNKRIVEAKVWYPPLPPRFQPYEEHLDRLAREVLGSTRLHNEVLFTPVPDVQVGHIPFGEVKLIHCLFTDKLR